MHFKLKLKIITRRIISYEDKANKQDEHENGYENKEQAKCPARQFVVVVLAINNKYCIRIQL